MGHKGKDAQDPLERLDKCVVELQDRHEYRYKITRSAAEREAAMALLVGVLEGLPILDELDRRCLTIFALCGVSIKKGSPREARLAYRAVGLLLLTLRDGSPGPLLAEAFPTLSRALQAQASHDDAPTLVAAINCLAAATFAGARDTEEVERARKAIWAVIVPTASSRSTNKIPAPKTIPVVLTAALSAWTFLLTITVSVTNGQRKADLAAWNATIASLAGLLDADDRTVRMAAGEALAVCVELNLTWHAPRKDMDSLVAKVSDLAAEPAGKGAKNTMLAEQKGLFRQIAAFLEHGERPEMSVRMSWERHGVLRVSTWVKLVQLNFLRRFLGGGFVKHVQGNALFNEAFSFGREEGKAMSIEKKQHSSKTKHKEYLEVKHDWDWEWKHVFSVSCYYRAEKMLQLGWH